MGRGKHFQYEMKKNMIQAAEEGRLIFTDSSYIEALKKDVNDLGEWVKLTNMSSKEMKIYFREHSGSRKNPYLKKVYHEYWLEKIREDEAYRDIDEDIEEMEIDHGFGGGCPYEDPSTFTKVVFTHDNIF